MLNQNFRTDCSIKVRPYSTKYSHATKIWIDPELTKHNNVHNVHTDLVLHDDTEVLLGALLGDEGRGGQVRVLMLQLTVQSYDYIINFFLAIFFVVVADLLGLRHKDKLDKGNNIFDAC